MIGYRRTPAWIEAEIDARYPGWRDKAGKAKPNAKGEWPGLWSEIKDLYVEIQNGKCAYCERELERGKNGHVEQDVEHFRPKGSVKDWQGSENLAKEGITFTPTPKGQKGYAKLAYHPLNYAIACKPCNSTLKSDRFPIASARDIDGDNPTALGGESPFLIFPVGDWDDLPEDLIRFNGASPTPVQETPGPKRQRALVTIEFFQLDSGKEREILVLQRAVKITDLYANLRNRDNAEDDDDKQVWVDLIAVKSSPALSHTNCARSFLDLYEKDRKKAKEIFDAARELLKSKSTPTPAPVTN